PIRYDPARKLLKYRGLMFSSSYRYLRGLSTNPAYLAAPDQLFVGTSQAASGRGRGGLGAAAVGGGVAAGGAGGGGGGGGVWRRGRRVPRQAQRSGARSCPALTRVAPYPILPAGPVLFSCAFAP